MGKIWKIAKTVLGLRMCSWSAAPVVDDGEEEEDDWDSRYARSCPATPARFPAHSMKSPQSFRVSKGRCAICLETIKSGTGQAVFTAECSHTFHFSCIASNVKHGNTVCPVCRANWKEVPWIAPPTNPPPALSPNPRPPRSAYMSPLRTFSPTYQDSSVRLDEDDHQPDPVIRIIDESIANARSPARQHPPEPLVYDDDESLVLEPSSGESSASAQRSSSAEFADVEQAFDSSTFKLQLETYPEVGSVSYSERRTSFNVLVHVKAPEGCTSPRGLECQGVLDPTQRAPIDLVTVLDVSGSMAGNKLVLLKRAMAFVIRNLSSRDRLSVVVFSSSAKRIFPLKAMVEEGRQFALRAIETLGCTGGTNITEGLRKGAKVLEERKFKNPVASIMLLSDGQDTYCMGTRGQIFPSENFIRQGNNRLINGHSPRIPVHTFGFGADHDAATMHSISQLSGGTFSFIQAEAGVQEAFAQCVGGLLSVVVQDVQLVISSPSGSTSLIKNVHAGSYRSSVSDDQSRATVKLGDLYADEERDILVELELPALQAREDECFVLDAGCSYTDPVLQHQICTSSRRLSVSRPDFVRANIQKVSVEVDRQKNRLMAARAITEAGSLAEAGDTEGAQRTIRASQVAIQNSLAAQAGDKLSKALEGELGEILAQVGNRVMYERYGRAYILSAQSSHLTQRATTRGYYNSTDDYQTPSMTGMILRSQQSPRLEISKYTLNV